MPAVSSATIAAVSRALTPVTTDLYALSKSSVQAGLSRWQSRSFPRRLAKRIGEITLVKTLWSPDEDVELTTFYYPPRVMVESRKRISVSTVGEIGAENYVIQGIVGQGKSIFLRNLAFQEAQLQQSARLPVFIELRTLQKGYELKSAILKTLASYDIDVSEEIFDYLCKSGRVALFLDAFDELDETLVKGVLNEIDFIRTKYPEVQMVITSRPGNEIQKVPGFRVLRISSLSPADYQPFLEKLGLKAGKTQEIIRAIHDSPSNLMHLIMTPLMLTLVVIVYESEKEIPPTLSEFFEKLFQIVFSRHDRLKAGFNRKLYSGLSERKLQGLFEGFCLMVMQNGFGRSLSSEQFAVAFNQAIGYVNDGQCDLESFRSDIVKVSCLMLEEGVDTTTFLHKSIMEYFGAAFIKHSSDDVAAMFYHAAIDSPKIWGEVVRFLSDIDKYRFSKEYAIPKIARIRNDFIRPLSEKKISVLLAFLNSMYGDDACPTYWLDPSEDKYRLLGHWPYSGEDILYEAFDELFVNATMSSLPESVTKEVLEEILGAGLDGVSVRGDIEIPLHRVVAYAGAEEFWKAIQIYENWLHRKESESKAHIESQEKRKLIFAPKGT